jgi:peptide/nickel transport system substrate-binding protein
LKAFGGMDFCDVVPKEWVEKWGKQFNRHPLGTGPFVFDHWTPAQEIILKRNPDYWDKGMPHLDQLKYVFSFDPQTAFLKMERGEVDVLLNHVPTSQLPRVEADPELSARLVTMTKMATQYLFMNTQMKPFDNVKVRQAISWAINREKLAKLLSGQGEALYQIYPKGMPGYVEGKKYYGYDVAKAKQLLAEAGYPDGFKTMLYCSNLDPYPKLMQSMQADLAAIGIKAEIKAMNDSTYNTFVGQPHSATMGFATWFMDFPDPSDWIIPFFSKSNAVEGGVNSAFWWTPELEQMISTAQSTINDAERTKQYEQMQDYIMGQAPYVTLYEPVEHSVPSTAVGGFYLHEAYEWDTQDFWRN